MNNFNRYIQHKFKGKDNADYLGDGAYVGFTGHSFIIFTSDGHLITNQVHLEQNELNSLNHFVEKIKNRGK
jgi:hypothetical protein